MDYKKLFLAKCVELEFKNVFNERHMNELENGGVGFFLEKKYFRKIVYFPKHFSWLFYLERRG